MLLSEYDILYVTQKVIKGSVQADYLAHQPIEDYQPMQSGFPDEDIFEDDIENTWTLLFNGTSKALGHDIGALLISPKK